MPLFGGAWIDTWSVAVSMSYSVVAVVGSASLLVYAAPATPGALSAASTVAAPLSTFTRRFCPVSLTMRSRSTVGLKSTPNEAPESGTDSCTRFAAAPVAGSIT